MNYWKIVLYALLIPFLVTAVNSCLQRSRSRSDNVVSMPVAFLVIGCLSGLCGGALAVLTQCGIRLTSVDSILSVLLWIVSGVCLLAYGSLYIRFDDDSFQCRIYFWKRTYRYSDIVGMIPGADGGYTLLMKKGRFYVDGLAVNGQEFLYFAEDCCFELGQGPIPDVPGGLFNGFVIEPIPKIIVAVLPGIALLALAIWASMQYEPVTVPQTLTTVQGTISDVVQGDRQVNLELDGRIFYIQREAIEEWPEFVQAIDAGKVFTFVYKPESTSDRFALWSVSDGERTYAKAEDVRRISQWYAYKVLMLFWGLVALFAVFLVWSCYILSHADKHPHLAALLVKKEHLNL